MNLVIINFCSFFHLFNLWYTCIVPIVYVIGLGKWMWTYDPKWVAIREEKKTHKEPYRVSFGGRGREGAFAPPWRLVAPHWEYPPFIHTCRKFSPYLYKSCLNWMFCSILYGKLPSASRRWGHIPLLHSPLGVEHSCNSTYLSIIYFSFSRYM